MKNLKFIVDNNNEGIEFLVEEKNRNDRGEVYITGPFLMHSKANGNGREYDAGEMSSEVDRYLKEMVQTRRAIGEMNHPQSTEVNPVNACHVVTELKAKDNYYMGKSKVLSTPMGELLKSFIRDNIQLGISTRGLGHINESGSTKKVSNFRLICLDVVHQPSVQNAMLESVMESKEWTLRSDGSIIEVSAAAYASLNGGLKNIPKHEADVYLREQLLKFIAIIRNNQ